MKALGRHISAWLMLSVLLPMVFVAPFHHHHDEHLGTEFSCDACAHHLPHPGHLSGMSDTDECLVCQFLAEQYIPSSSLVVDLVASDLVTLAGSLPDAFIPCPVQLPSSRAPPVSFLF
jgi:hypothetical protein